MDTVEVEVGHAQMVHERVRKARVEDPRCVEVHRANGVAVLVGLSICETRGWLVLDDRTHSEFEVHVRAQDPVSPESSAERIDLAPGGVVVIELPKEASLRLVADPTITELVPVDGVFFGLRGLREGHTDLVVNLGTNPTPQSFHVVVADKPPPENALYVGVGEDKALDLPPATWRTIVGDPSRTRVELRGDTWFVTGIAPGRSEVFGITRYAHVQDVVVIVR